MLHFKFKAVGGEPMRGQARWTEANIRSWFWVDGKGLVLICPESNIWLKLPPKHVCVDFYTQFGICSCVFGICSRVSGI